MRLQRRLDLDHLHRHVARDLVGHQHADLVQQAAEAAGAACPSRASASACAAPAGGRSGGLRAGSSRALRVASSGPVRTRCRRSPMAHRRRRRRAALCAISRPAAQVPPSSTQASGSVGCAELGAHQRAPRRRAGARSARAIRRRQRSRRRVDLARVGGVARHDARRRRCSRPPLRYSGRPVSSSRPVDLDAGPLEAARPANRSATGSACGTAPGRRRRRSPPACGCGQTVADRLAAAARCPLGQIGAEGLRAAARRMCGAPMRSTGTCWRGPPSAAPWRAQQVEQRARPRRRRRTRRAARAAPRPAGAAAQRGRPGRPAGCPGRPGRSARQLRRVERSQRRRVDAQRHAPVATRSAPARKACRLATARPSERTKRRPAGGSA